MIQSRVPVDINFPGQHALNKCCPTHELAEAYLSTLAIVNADPSDLLFFYSRDLIITSL